MASAGHVRTVTAANVSATMIANSPVVHWSFPAMLLKSRFHAWASLFVNRLVQAEHDVQPYNASSINSTHTEF
jgi:hypothetical protein